MIKAALLRRQIEFVGLVGFSHFQGLRKCNWIVGRTLVRGIKESMFFLGWRVARAAG